MTAAPPPSALAPARTFTQRFSSTPRGARLARHLALAQLHTWGIPHDTRTSDSVAVIVAELAANSVTHGRVPGRDFELRLSLVPGSIRIEVTDTRGEARVAVREPHPLDETGRGLQLVEVTADRWEVIDRQPPPGKTVRAEVDVPNWLSLARISPGSRGRSSVAGTAPVAYEGRSVAVGGSDM